MNNKKAKISLICWSVATAIFVIGLILSCVFSITGLIMCSIVFLIMGILGIISAIQDIKMPKDNNKNNLSNSDKQLLSRYLEIKDDEYSEVGYASFVNEGIKFSCVGKYGYIKNFNGKLGYHLAFNIKGTGLVDKPENYEDIVDYEDLLFNIDLGYFEDLLLSQPENDNGIIVKNVNNLEGQTVKIAQHSGYIATISTAETDEIDVGEIKFIEWNKDSKIIRFKLVVGYGLCDIVVGTVKLSEDK